MSIRRSHHTHYNGVVVETTESYEADDRDRLIIVSPEANPALGTPVQIILPLSPPVGAAITIVATDRTVRVRSSDDVDALIPSNGIFQAFWGGRHAKWNSSAIVPPESPFLPSAFSKAGASSFITPAEVTLATINFNNRPGPDNLELAFDSFAGPVFPVLFISATASLRARLDTLPETIDVFAIFRIVLTRTNGADEILSSFSFNLTTASNVPGNGSGVNRDNQNGSGAAVERIAANRNFSSISLRMSLSSSRNSDNQDTHISVFLDPNQNNASLYAQVMRR